MEKIEKTWITHFTNERVKKVFSRILAGGVMFFLVKGIIWLVVMAAIMLGIL